MLLRSEIDVVMCCYVYVIFKCYCECEFVGDYLSVAMAFGGICLGLVLNSNNFKTDICILKSSNFGQMAVALELWLFFLEKHCILTSQHLTMMIRKLKIT